MKFKDNISNEQMHTQRDTQTSQNQYASQLFFKVESIKSSDCADVKATVICMRNDPRGIL